MKEHEARELVNRLRDIALKFRDAGQLRERIAAEIRTLISSSASPAGYDVDLVKRLQQRVVELSIELSQHKEAVYNYMSMGHAGEENELVDIFMETHLPDEPDDKVLAS